MYRERPLLEIALIKSEVEKRLQRFSFIRAEAFISHPFSDAIKDMKADCNSL